MKICVVCRAKTVRNATETFHRFPSNTILAQQWAKAIGRENVAFGKWSYICSKHFEDKCFENRYSIKNPGKIMKALVPKSIPTLFLGNNPSVRSTSSDSLYEPQRKKSLCDASTSNKENEVPCNIKEWNSATGLCDASTSNKETEVVCNIEESNLATGDHCWSSLIMNYQFSIKNFNY